MWCILFGIVQFACGTQVQAEYAKRCAQTQVGMAHLRRAGAECVTVQAMDDAVPGAGSAKKVCNSVELAKPISEHIDWLCAKP